MNPARQLRRVDGRAALAAGASTPDAADAAMLRAYTVARSIDYGGAIDDVLAMHRRVEAGARWVETALQLADDNLQRAAQAQAGGYAASARRFHLHAAACFRLAQAALEHRPAERLEAYERLQTAFAAAMDGSSAEPTRFDLPHHGVPHGGWLFAAPAADRDRPCVVVWGGADGWAEAFYPSVAAFHEKGLSVALIELPGQGIARLRGGSFMRADFTTMVSGVLDALSLRGFGQGGFGVVGHSLGGCFALAAAAADRRIKACCTNGGSVSPALGLGRYPRVLERVGRMLGDGCLPAQVFAFVDELRLPEVVRRMTPALLCLHGGQDVLVSDDEAASLVAMHGGDATLERWPDGVHCLYDVAVERNSVMTAWFASRLSG